ncbi:MAG TPA: type II toxin-antitoxin system VapC family toxin [Candidatus Limnocylindrales bacterium]|nr:type II toxin-antitoxin system VapC family toxin [Candidatus Limnocylindrales bacterium]
MTVYVESSAIVTWLLDQPGAAEVEAVLSAAGDVISSELTLIECDRALHRLRAVTRPGSVNIESMRARLAVAAAAWALEPVTGRVVDRARSPFPDDTIRSLDAIHVATAVVVGASLGKLDVLSLDERIRSNAVALGFRVLPD